MTDYEENQLQQVNLIGARLETALKAQDSERYRVFLENLVIDESKCEELLRNDRSLNLLRSGLKFSEMTLQISHIPRFAKLTSLGLEDLELDTQVIGMMKLLETLSHEDLDSLKGLKEETLYPPSRSLPMDDERRLRIASYDQTIRILRHTGLIDSSNELTPLGNLILSVSQ